MTSLTEKKKKMCSCEKELLAVKCVVLEKFGDTSFVENYCVYRMHIFTSGSYFQHLL